MTPSLRDPDLFDAWLHRMLVHACIDEARRLRRHRLDIELTTLHAPAIAGIESAVVDRDQLERGGPPGEAPAAWAFTPDGTALMVRYGDDADGTTHVQSLDGSAATDLGSGGFEFLDMRRLAP